MSLESSADFQAYMTAFGVPAVVSGRSITAIFDNEYSDLLDVSTSSPTLTCVSADVSGVGYGDTAIIPSVPFSGTVRVVMPDGYGITVLLLGKSN